MIRELPAQIVGRAEREIRVAAEWWAANRPAAPGAVEDELRKGLLLIRSQPLIGAVATNVHLPGVRRIHLSRIRYHLYYRLLEDPPRIEVLALWHTSRGSGPRLP